MILAAILGFILLNILMPPSEAHCYVECTPAYGVYIFIEALTVLAVFIYAAVVAVRDHEQGKKGCDVCVTRFNFSH
jgi:hypothetical protein